MIGTWFVAAPLFVALAAALVGLAVDAFGAPRTSLLTAAAGLVLATAGFAAAGVAWPSTPLADVVVFGGTRSVVAAVVCGLGALALAAGSRTFGRREHAGQTAALVAFSAAASCLLVAAIDLAVFVVALELVSLAGYALVAAARTGRAYEAAMKYFVQGAIATAVLFYSVAVLFGLYGQSLRFDALGATLAGAGSPRPLVTALVLLLAALAFKLGAFPFHSWAPDAYETAPASVTAYLATVPKLAAVLATLVMLEGVFGAQADVWRPLVAAMATASIVFGNLAALKQTSYRRMLAYSGIAQVGYALAGVAARAVPFVVLFSVAYSLAAAGAFLAAEAAGEGREWDGRIAGLAGLGTARPLVSASLAVCLLSLTGIPLTMGFWGKFLVFGAAAAPQGGLLWLAIVGVLGSVVSFGYYGGVLRAVYLDETPAGAPEPAEAELGEPVPEIELAPRSLGAMAADDSGEGSGRGGWAVVLMAALLLAGGVVPLFAGLSVFSFLGR